MQSSPSLGWRRDSRRKLRRHESGREAIGPLRRSVSAHSFGLQSNGVRGAFPYLQSNHFEFLALDDLRTWSSAFRTTKQLYRAESVLCAATGTNNHHRNFFNHQARTLQSSILAGHFITGEECVFHHAGEGSQL